ncbi:hypothetical protein [Bdellovibrio sp. HCB288]|uniref:hypothetical protein n=1 Tax=Bdellovibrio sp. HCB288 TaxID=3394355 RepID=UPI0039B56381
MKILIFFVVIFFSTLSIAQDAGVLLGFYQGGEDQASSYKTYWLGTRANKPFMAGPLNDLLVPTVKGFYRVGTRDGCMLKLSMDTGELMYIVRPDQQPSVELQSCTDAKINLEKSLKKKPLKESEKCIDGCDPREANTTIRTQIKMITGKSILFLRSENFVSERHLDSREKQIQVRSFDDSATGYFNNFQPKDFIPDAKAIIPENEEEKSCIEYNAGKYEFVTWSVARNPFVWEFEGFLPTHRLCGVGIEFKSALKVNTPEVGPLVPGGIIAQLAGKEDGFISPDGRTVVSIDSSGFEIYSVKEGKLVSIFKKSAKLRQLVMQEWASGESVEQWDKIVTGILANKWKEAKYEKYNPKKHPGR